MLLILVVIVLNLILGFTAAVVLGYGPPGLAEIWVAASGEMAGHRGRATNEVGSSPEEQSMAQQPEESPSAHNSDETPPPESVFNRQSKPAEQLGEQLGERPSLSSIADAELTAEDPAATDDPADDSVQPEPAAVAV